MQRPLSPTKRQLHSQTASNELLKPRRRRSRSRSSSRRRGNAHGTTVSLNQPTSGQAECISFAEINTQALASNSATHSGNQTAQFSVFGDKVSKLNAVNLPLVSAKPLHHRPFAYLRRIGTHSLAQNFLSAFLPVGYPDSVSSDYGKYQLYDSLQSLCSSSMGVLCTHAVLKGVGVGNAEASSLSATLQWAGREVVGRGSRVLFGWWKGSDLDVYPKTWRLMADGCNDVAMAMDLATPFVPQDSLFVWLCLSSTARSITGVCGGASRAAMTQHFARRDNFGDIAAKDDVQEMAVGVVGLLIGMRLTSLLGELPDTQAKSIGIAVFATLVCLHMIFNWLACRAVRLSTLNPPRLEIVLNEFHQTGNVVDPEQVRSKEPMLLSGLINQGSQYSRSVGISLAQLFSDNDDKFIQSALQRWASQNFENDFALFHCTSPKKRGYFAMVATCKDRTIINASIAIGLAELTSNTSGSGYICSHEEISSIQKEAIRLSNALISAGWNLNAHHLPWSGHVLQPSCVE